MNKFKSIYAGKLDMMLQYRVARGFKQDTHGSNLLKFDAYCVKHFPHETELTREVVHAWLDSETAAEHDIRTRASSIRQFGKYLCAVGEPAYVLPEKFAHHTNRFVPYIFTDSELTALFAEVDKLPQDKNEPFIHEIAPVLFRLIYTCGLRPNEGRGIEYGNVDLSSGEVLVANTKRNKERIVVMSDDMVTLCRDYDLRRKIFANGSPYFFPSNNGGQFTAAKIYTLLNKAWVSAACSPQNPVPRPIRVYDLRHRFASACLNNWLNQGRNLMVMLPYLREYMGHGSMNETAYYIHILPENLIKSSAVDWTELNSLLPEVGVCPN